MPTAKKKTGSMHREPECVNKDQCRFLAFERLASEISDSFIRILPDQIDEKVLSALGKIRNFIGVDRCGLVQLDRDRQQWQITHFVFHPDIPDLPLNENLTKELFPWVYEQLLMMHNPVIFSSTDQLPAEAAVDKKTYHEWGILSHLAVPIAVDRSLNYGIVITSDRKESVWSAGDILRLRLLGEVLVKAVLLNHSLLPRSLGVFVSFVYITTGQW